MLNEGRFQTPSYLMYELVTKSNTGSWLGKSKCETVMYLIAGYGMIKKSHEWYGMVHIV